jgi:hypothetical protein
VRGLPTSLVIALWVAAASWAVAILAILFDAGSKIVWSVLPFGSIVGATEFHSGEKTGRSFDSPSGPASDNGARQERNATKARGRLSQGLARAGALALALAGG